MSDKDQFIAELYPAATKVSKETGMSRDLILAQAAQETGWGEKVLPGTNNIFNIKAAPDWHGPTKTFNVPEFEHGKKVMVSAEFRVYGSVEEALQDRVKFLKENPRYAKAGLFDEGTKGNLEKEAAALQKAGYATDPKYAEQLAAVYNGPTMQRAIKHAQEQATPTTRAPAASETQTHNASRGKTHTALLIEGANGPAVHTLQNELGKLGYTGADGKPLPSTGHFGPDTKHAVESFQRDHHLVPVDGKVGPVTQAALHTAVQATVLPTLDDKRNPDNALYQQALVGVHKIDADMGRTPDQQSSNVAAALTASAKAQGLTRIDTIALSEDGSRAFAVQGPAGSPLRQMAYVQTAEAVNTSIDKSSAVAQAVLPKPVEPMMPAPLAAQPSQQNQVM